MNPYEVSNDPLWHRFVDGLVILVIGLAAGLVLAQALLAGQTVTTTTTTEILRRAPSDSPQIESGVQTDVPSGHRVEES